MMLSIENALRRLLFMILIDPRLLLMLINIPLISASFFINSLVFSFVAILISFLSVMYVGIKTLSRRCITPNFYRVSYLGRNYIYQYRNNKAIEGVVEKYEVKPCEGILIYEINNLLKRLPNGRFVAITHDFVIQILENNNIKIQRCIPAFKKDLLTLQNSMFGCCDCDPHKACRIRHNGSEIKQFYYIKFKIKREEQPNPVR